MAPEDLLDTMVVEWSIYDGERHLVHMALIRSTKVSFFESLIACIAAV